MQPNDLAEFERVFSATRLDAYRPPGASDVDRLANYLWNLYLSDALYPTLHVLEIALRNAVHTAVSRILADPLWLRSTSTILLPRERDAVAKAEFDLTRRNRTAEPGRVVAELMFGFWTAIFSRPYELPIWQGGRVPLAAVFSHAPATALSRSTVHARLNEIRDLRNRVFHYEPIWNRPGLVRLHADMLEIIGWISSPLAGLTGRIDTFARIHASGPSNLSGLLT